MDEKEIIIFKKPSKWTAWRLQRRILKKHAYIWNLCAALDHCRS